ncbi:type VI secretion system protein TssA [Rhodoferax sp.]|uniref:type VI secretion system protein TssA n=1 Tax=Rhodoferax sp. TaxID=50421 RepID=UPI00275A7582|nr:type VI secretion system protein TssA [Rhodoferax sp.]
MLSPELMAALLAPVSDALPCGEDLEYDAAFSALEVAARFKSEQQFGDSVIPAVEPDWRSVAEQAIDLLRRTKDLRVAILLLRACARLQGLAGFSMGLQLLTSLLETYWDTVHPQLDADDDNDPTMRLNAIAPLIDPEMALRDLHDARVGTARALGVILVRDIEQAFGRLSPKDGQPSYTTAQIEGAISEMRASDPSALDFGAGLRDQIDQLKALLDDRVSGGQQIDVKPLRDIATLLRQTCSSAVVEPEVGSEGQDTPGSESGAGQSAGGGSGQLRSRQDAISALDRVIAYLEQAEPGNPAPLLIKRAQRLIGVSFLEIMSDLAPEALGSIENITGRSASS